jgi:hypothetical protein
MYVLFFISAKEFDNNWSFFIAASSGTAEADFERLTEILTTVKDLKFVCLDVANGYTQHFVEYVRRVRAAFPTHTIIVSLYYLSKMIILVSKLYRSNHDIHSSTISTFINFVTKFHPSYIHTTHALSPKV